MKLLLLLFLVGYAAASASFYDALDQAADEVVAEFMAGMESAPSLKRSLGFDEDDEETEFAFALAEEDIKTELGKKLREALDKLLEKIKDAVEQGKTVKGDLIEKLKDLKQKMKDLKIDVGAKAKDLFNKIKDKAKDFLKKILDQLDLGGKDEAAYADFNIKNIFKKLKKAILDKIDKEELKKKVESLFGKGSELADQLLNLLKEKGEKGKNKILEIIDRVLGKDDETEFSIERRSIKDLFEKVKNYFKDLNIDLKEKFVKFGEWVKETVKKGIDKSKTKLENIKAIATEFTNHAKQVSKEVAVEALEFLRPYKEDLGELWEKVKESVKEVIQRKE